jgi:YggT family protein
MIELLQFISYVLTLYVYIVIAMAIMSWLIAFNVVNTRNQIVAMIWDLLYRLTEPVLRPIRNMMPNLGGIDISPIILFLIILFIQTVILPNIAKLFI